MGRQLINRSLAAKKAWATRRGGSASSGRAVWKHTGMRWNETAKRVAYNPGIRARVAPGEQHLALVRTRLGKLRVLAPLAIAANRFSRKMLAVGKRLNRRAARYVRAHPKTFG